MNKPKLANIGDDPNLYEADILKCLQNHPITSDGVEITFHFEIGGSFTQRYGDGDHLPGLRAHEAAHKLAAWVAQGIKDQSGWSGSGKKVSEVTIEYD